MKSFLQMTSIKLNPFFIVLVTLSFSVFAFVMFNLARLPTPEEKQHEFDEKMNAVMLAEEAQHAGISIDEVKRKHKQSASVQRLLIAYNKAVAKNDNEALVPLIAKIAELLKTSKLASTGFPQRIHPNILSDAILAENTFATNELLKIGIPCDNRSNTGKAAFRRAVKAKNPIYLQYLLDHHCDFDPNSSQSGRPRSLETRILKSRYPEKIFKLSDKYIDPSYRDTALITALKKRAPQASIFEMIELGANPNASEKNSKTSALSLSIGAGMPDVALRLMKEGADFRVPNTRKIYPFTQALTKGYFKVVHQMLKQDPSYIRREKLGNRSFALIFMMTKDRLKRLEAVKLLLSNGVKPNEFYDSGSQWLIQAIRSQDLPLVKVLLASGIPVNHLSRLQTPLSIAKSQNSPNKEDLIALLEHYGAIDDVLKLIRKQTGVKKSANCTIGKHFQINMTSATAVLMQKKLERPPYPSKTSNKGCNMAISVCTNQGFGSDDCMYSVPTCKLSDLDKPTLCCQSHFKKSYVEARCAGLEVEKAFRWINLQKRANKVVTHN